jgi:hypothetical protein
MSGDKIKMQLLRSRAPLALIAINMWSLRDHGISYLGTSYLGIPTSAFLTQQLSNTLLHHYLKQDFIPSSANPPSKPVQKRTLTIFICHN